MAIQEKEIGHENADYAYSLNGLANDLAGTTQYTTVAQGLLDQGLEVNGNPTKTFSFSVS